MSEPPPLLFSFGVVSDVQYADREDGHNYLQTKIRRYRAALDGLRRAVARWQGEEEAGGEGKGFFVLQLGDLVDGFAAATALGSEGTLNRLLAELGKLRCPVYHCIGAWSGLRACVLMGAVGEMRAHVHTIKHQEITSSTTPPTAPTGNGPSTPAAPRPINPSLPTPSSASSASTRTMRRPWAPQPGARSGRWPTRFLNETRMPTRTRR